MIRASEAWEPSVERGDVSIWRWVQRLAPLCDRFDVERKLVRTIFVDETMIKVRGRRAWVWVAYEPGLRVFLAFRVSYNQSILDAYLFLKELRTRYGLKPIWTDEATWYPEACRWARLEHRVYGQEWKNLIERMNQLMKDRLENFGELFPGFQEDLDLEEVNNWIGVFRFYHNYVRTNEDIGRAPLQYDDLPEYRRFENPILEGSLS